MRRVMHPRHTCTGTDAEKKYVSEVAAAVRTVSTAPTAAMSRDRAAGTASGRAPTSEPDRDQNSAHIATRQHAEAAVTWTMPGWAGSACALHQIAETPMNTATASPMTPAAVMRLPPWLQKRLRPVPRLTSPRPASARSEERIPPAL